MAKFGHIYRRQDDKHPLFRISQGRYSVTDPEEGQKRPGKSVEVKTQQLWVYKILQFRPCVPHIRKDKMILDGKVKESKVSLYFFKNL